MSRRYPWTVEILRLIDEGVTDREDVITRTIPFVPIGHAYRIRERVNADQTTRRAKRGQVIVGPRTTSMSEMHRIGARHVITSTLLTLRRCGTIVLDGNIVKRP